MGRCEPHIIELTHTGRHGPMDGSRALRTGEVWSQGQPPNDTLRLLRAWNGDIRGSERASTVSRLWLLCRGCKGQQGRTPRAASRSERGMVHGQCLGGFGTLLEARTGRPSENRRCTPVLGGSFKVLDPTLPDSGKPTDGGFTRAELF
jgi:hypothetical protein